MKSGIDFSNSNVTITDSSGASGTIVKQDIGTIQVLLQQHLQM